MKNIPQRSPLVMVTLVITMLLLILVRGLIVSGQTPQQSLPQIKLFVDVDRLTIFIDSSVPVSLATIELQTAASDGTVQNRQLVNHFNGALQLSGGMANPGDCYIFEQSGTSTPLPSQCNPSTTHIESVSPASIFWYDRVTHQFATLAILENSLSIGFCPAGSNCMIPLETVTPPLPTISPFILQGSNNTGTIRLASVDDIVNQTGMGAWRDAGFSGQGVRIGVIDRHFGGLGTFQTGFGVSVNFVNPSVSSTSGNDNITLGVNVLEVIHGIAPDADLYACQYAEFSEFQACVTWMIQQDVDIINHSASIPVVQPDGQSVWAQEVTRATDHHILWIDAAGNFDHALLKQEFRDNDGNSKHEFSGAASRNETYGFDQIPNLTGAVMLSWDDFAGRPANSYDLDLVVIDVATGDVIAQSNRQQGSGTTDATEYLTFDMRQPFGIQVLNASNAPVDDLVFVLYVEYATLPDSEQIAFTTPADSPDALTVGALQDGRAAPYSPGGTVASKNKPDLVTHGEIQLRDGTQFVGTSAAAPVVSGYAALVLSGNPTFSRTELLEFITRESTQDDVEVAGPDPRYGNYGILHIPTRVAVTETLIPTPVPTEGPLPSESTDRAVAIVDVAAANLRLGPGVVYGRIGAAYAGDEFVIEGQALNWYRVEQSEGESAWIAASIVRVAPENVVVAAINNYPDPPPTRLPQPTNVFPPPPATDAGRNVPGGVIFTPTSPPRLNLTLTLFETVTPNATTTLQHVQTVTGVSVGLTTMATLKTNTPTPSPTTSVGPPSTRTPTVSPTSTAGPMLTISVPTAILRAGPGTNYLEVGQANQGDQFPVIAYHASSPYSWYLVERPDLSRVWVANIVGTANVPNEQLSPPATVPPSPIPTNTPIVSNTPIITNTPNSPTQGVCQVRIEAETMSGGITFGRSNAMGGLTRRIGNSGGDGALTGTFSVGVNCTVQVGVTYSNDHFDGNDTEWIIVYIDGNQVGAFQSVNTGLGIPAGEGWNIFDGRNVNVNGQTATYSLTAGDHTIVIVASGGNENPAEGIEIDYLLIGSP